MEKRIFKAQSSNIEVRVTGYGTYIDDKDLDLIIRENIEQGTFRAKVTIIIEEVAEGLDLVSNKPKEEKMDGEAEDI